MKKFENAIGAVEHNICINYKHMGKVPKNKDTHDYENLDPLPTYKKIVSNILNSDTSNYNQKTNFIKIQHSSLGNDSNGIGTYYTQGRNTT